MVCSVCSGPLPPRHTVTCSKACRNHRLLASEAFARGQRNRGGTRSAQVFCRLPKDHPARRPRPERTWYSCRCERCGGSFVDLRRARFCSRPCMRMDAVDRYRARRRGNFVERINRRRVFDRDGWICGICGEPVDPALAHPDLRSASVDHVIPLARGGAHRMSNVQCAHLICNSRKRISVPDMGTGSADMEDRNARSRPEARIPTPAA